MLLFLNFLQYAFEGSAPPYMLIFILVPYSFFLFSFSRGALKQKGYKQSFSFANPDFLLMCWLIVPCLILYVKSVISSPVLTVRYLVIIFPAACLLLARSLALLPLKTFYIGIVCFLITCIFLFRLVFTEEYYARPGFAQVRESVQLVSKIDPELKNSVILLYAPGYLYHNVDYYFERLSFEKRYTATEWKNGDAQSITKIIQENKPAYLWLLSSRRIPDFDSVSGRYFKNDKVLLNNEFVQFNVKLIKLTYPR
jgi:hypothetical protein